jgi:hypothetical protein
VLAVAHHPAPCAFGTLRATVPAVQKVVIIIDAAVGVFLLYWLDTSAARALFVRKGSSRRSCPALDLRPND